MQKPDHRAFTCGMILLWLLAGGSAAWALFIGLANTTTQGYALSKKAILLQFGPGAVVFALGLPLLIAGLRRRGPILPVILTVFTCALGAVFLVLLIVNLLGG